MLSCRPRSTRSPGAACPTTSDHLESHGGDRYRRVGTLRRSYPDELPRLASPLGDIETPVSIIACRRDRVVPLVNAEFAQRASCRALSVGEGPDEDASIVLDWITSLA